MFQLNSFPGGFLVGILLILLTLAVLRLAITILTRNKEDEFVFDSDSETTNWINQTLYTMFMKLTGTQKVESVGSLKIRSLGNPPTVKGVSIVPMSDPDDINFTARVVWTDGPSFDIPLKLFTLEVDLDELQADVQFIWLGSDEKKSLIKLMNRPKLAGQVHLSSFCKINLLEIPFVSSMLTLYVQYFLGKQSYQISF